MMKVDQFGYAWKIRMGAAGQNDIARIPYGGNAAPNLNGGHPQQMIIMQPGEKALKRFQETGIGKIGLVPEVIQIQAKHHFDIGRLIIAIGYTAFLETVQFATNFFARFARKALQVFPKGIGVLGGMEKIPDLINGG